MTLRSDIESTITAAASPHEAAIAVCALLESKMDLEGNGWFDDDEEFRERILGSKDESADSTDCPSVIEWPYEDGLLVCHIDNSSGLWSAYVGIPQELVDMSNPSSWPDGMTSNSRKRWWVKAGSEMQEKDARGACVAKAMSLYERLREI